MLTTPKRVTETSATLIDVIQTNNSNNISHKTVINAGLSDHDLIACVRKMNNIKHKPVTIRCRNFKNYGVDAINIDLSNKNWNPVFETNSPTVSWSPIKSLFTETLDHYTPFLTKQVKGKPSP